MMMDVTCTRRLAAIRPCDPIARVRANIPAMNQPRLQRSSKRRQHARDNRAAAPTCGIRCGQDLR
jgi:hypothetical protein